jgi:hypothetical protein
VQVQVDYWGWIVSLLFDPYLHINSWSKKLLFSFLKIVAMVDNAMLSDTGG